MVWKRSEDLLSPLARRACVEKTVEMPTRKRKVGKTRSVGGEAVPVGVLHGPVGVVAAAVVVDHDHEADGEAAEDVDGEPAVDFGDGGGAFDGGEDGCGHGCVDDDDVISGRLVLSF